MNEGGWDEGGRTDRSADGHRLWVHANRKPQRSRVTGYSVLIVIIIMLTG